MKFTAILAMLLSLTVHTATAQEGANPVVVELFTSQSCSSCPPADAVLGELAGQPNVIALGCHVTYWDHLSWKDTLSLDACTKHQNGFNGAIGSGRVYTPQMVVNGRAEFVGSRGDTARDAVKNAAGLVPLSLQIKDGGIVVSVPTLPAGKNAPIIMLVGFDQTMTQPIGRGENGGRTVSYTNPVSSLSYPSGWDGKAHSVTLPLPTRNATGGYAVLIRDGRAGPIIAAGQLKL